MTSPEETLAELVQHVELIEVRYLEVSAKVRRGPAEDISDDHLDLRTEVEVARRNDQFGVRLRANADSKPLEVVVDLAATYGLRDGAQQPDDDVMGLFVQKVAFMTLWPFVRECTHDLSSRMRIGLPDLPIITAQQVPDFDLQPEDGAETV